MGQNSKPILSVLVDADKKEKFADLARQHKYSMGWLLNDCIDRMLAANSIEVYRDSIGNAETNPTAHPIGIPATDIEELAKAYIDEKFESISNSSIDITDIEKLVSSSIDKRGLMDEDLVTGIIDRKLGSLDERLKAEIEPLADLLTELETYTQNQFKAVREEVKKPLAIV